VSFAGIAGPVMQAQLGTAKRLSTKPMTGLTEPIAAFGCGLVTKALQLQGIEFSERSLGSDGPLLVLIQFVQKWLPEYSEDYTELARFVARAGAEEKYEKYLKCGWKTFSSGREFCCAIAALRRDNAELGHVPTDRIR
jgi:hypothetical protein